MLSSKMISKPPPPSSHFHDPMPDPHQELSSMSIVELMGARSPRYGESTSNIPAKDDSFIDRIERRIARESRSRRIFNWTQIEADASSVRAREARFRQSWAGVQPPAPVPTRSAYFTQNNLLAMPKISIRPELKREDLIKTGSKIYGPAAISAVSQMEVQKQDSYNPSFYFNIRTRPVSPLFTRKQQKQQEPPITSRFTRRVRADKAKVTEESPPQPLPSPSLEDDIVPPAPDEFQDSYKTDIAPPTNNSYSTETSVTTKSASPSVQRSRLTMSMSNNDGVMRSNGKTKSEMTFQKKPQQVRPAASPSVGNVVAGVGPRSVMIPIKLPGEMRNVDIQKVNRMYQNRDIIDESEKRVKIWLDGQSNRPRTPFTTSKFSNPNPELRVKSKSKRKGKKKVKSGRKPRTKKPDKVRVDVTPGPDSRPAGPKIIGLCPLDAAAETGPNPIDDGSSGKRPVIRTIALPYPQSRFKRVMDT